MSPARRPPADPTYPTAAVGRRNQASDRRRRCGTKHRYRDELEARGAAAGINRQPQTVGRVHPYQCPYCAGWHVGRRRSERPDTGGPA